MPDGVYRVKTRNASKYHAALERGKDSLCGRMRFPRSENGVRYQKGFPVSKPRDKICETCLEEWNSMQGGNRLG